MAGTNEDATNSQGPQMDAQNGRAEHGDRSATDSAMSAGTLSSDAETSPISPERRSIADQPEDTSHAPDETETTPPNGATSVDAASPPTDAFPAEVLSSAPTGPVSDMPANAHQSAAAAAFESIPTPQSPEAVAARRVRRVSVGILAALSCLGILLSSVTIWTHQEFLDTDNWIGLVGPLGQNPNVVNAVSTYAANEVVIALNVQQRAEQALPPRAQFLAAPLTRVVHDFTQKRVADLMHTQQFQNVWIATNRYVHAEILAALRGQTKNVIIANGTVTLNLIPVINQALQALQHDLSGLIPANVTFPTVTELQVPAQARAKLSQTLGVQLPANFGEITLFHSDQLATAQQLLRVFDVLMVLLPIITVLLIAATIWFSLDRRRTLIQLGIGVAITFLIMRLVVGYLAGRVIDDITNPTAQAMAGDVISSAVSGLLTLTVLLLIAGVVTVIVAYLFGKPEWFAAAYAGGKVGYAWARTSFGRAREEIGQRRGGSRTRPQERAAQGIQTHDTQTPGTEPQMAPVQHDGAQATPSGAIAPQSAAPQSAAPQSTTPQSTTPRADQQEGGPPPGALAHDA